MMNTIISTICIFLATIGTCIVFNIKRKHLVVASLISSIGWVIYSIALIKLKSEYIAIFLAAANVGIIGEIISRYKKAPATIFILPGIIPLVPGTFIYYTMLNITNKNYIKATDFGIKTVFISLSIACGIIISMAFRKILIKIKPRKK